MTTASPTVAQAPRVTADQIAQFKRDGFLVLPGAIDPELCGQARDQMWDTIADHRPSMRRSGCQVPEPAAQLARSAIGRSARGAADSGESSQQSSGASLIRGDVETRA